MKRYWQQTVDGDEVLMNTNGYIYKTKSFNVEFYSKDKVLLSSLKIKLPSVRALENLLTAEPNRCIEGTNYILIKDANNKELKKYGAIWIQRHLS